jgi:hypothetical protein
MFALFVLTFFMIFAHTYYLFQNIMIKCEMNELHSYANLLLYTLESNTFSNIFTRIAINVLLRDVLSRLIFFISFVHIFNNDQFSILIWHAKSLWINTCLNSFFCLVTNVFVYWLHVGHSFLSASHAICLMKTYSWWSLNNFWN